MMWKEMNKGESKRVKQDLLERLNSDSTEESVEQVL